MTPRRGSKSEILQAWLQSVPPKAQLPVLERLVGHRRREHGVITDGADPKRRHA
jgi:hypothetical protein